MELKDKVVVVTGGASGIGAELCRRFTKEGARGIAVADRNEADAVKVAEDIGGLAIPCDVGNEADVIRIVEETESKFGPIDLFCSNAGIAFPDQGNAASAPNDQWQTIWDVNVMAHVYAARAVLPGMIARGEGYLMNTASAAGLLSQIGSATYAVTKHAAVAFAESLAITHGADGIKVSVLCPQAVNTPLLGSSSSNVASVDGVIETSELADVVVQGLADETFLILPHPVVLKYMQRKTADYDRWLSGMQRLRERYVSGS